MWKCFSLLASVIPAAHGSPILSHINSVNCNLIPLSIPFVSGEYTLPLCYMDKLLGLILLQVLDSLPCVVLFPSYIPAKLASNKTDFLKTKTVICTRPQ